MSQNAPGLGELNERVRSLEEITESEHRFRKLVEALPDAIVVHTEGKIVFVNPFALARSQPIWLVTDKSVRDWQMDGAQDEASKNQSDGIGKFQSCGNDSDNGGCDQQPHQELDCGVGRHRLPLSS